MVIINQFIIKLGDEHRIRQLLNSSSHIDSLGSFRDVSIAYFAGTLDKSDL